MVKATRTIYPDKETDKFYSDIAEKEERSYNQVVVNALREYKKILEKKNEERI